MTTAALIGALGPTGGGADPSATTDTAMGRDDFLKLLLTQMGSQDPSAPMDAQQFVAQLATFANVEQLQHANTRLESMLLAQAASNQLSAANLVGKTARFKGEALSIGKEGVSGVNRVQLDGEAKDVTVTIKDSKGDVVRTLHLGSMKAGINDFKFDGLDNKGKPLPDGDYKVTVSAIDAAKAPVGASMLQEHTVDAVTYAGGFPQLVVGDTTVNLADVLEVRAP